MSAVERFQACEHRGAFEGRREYCLEEREDLDVYARTALEALDRLIYAAPRFSTFERHSQFAEREVSYWDSDMVAGADAWPLTESRLYMRHEQHRPFGTESYLVTDSWSSLHPDIEGSMVTKYYFDMAPAYPIEAVVEAYDFEEDRRLLRPMTEYDYKQLVEQLDVAERHVAVRAA